jgi:phosphate transport system substrate-binding protein
VTINYQSIGSGGGIQQITQKTVDFGASDAPMTDDQIKAAPGILHIPMVHGPVVATYNLKLDVNTPLRFSGQTLVDIYSGMITKWNDKAIMADNPGAALPTTDIAVVYRSDGSGTTSIWVDYFSKISTEWERKVGRGTSVKFPTGFGAKGNEGVAGQVKQIEGGIGYVELAYALENKLPVSLVKNAGGEFVAPSVDSASKAAVLPSYPDDLRFSITNPPAEITGAYPITGTTWLLLSTQEADKKNADALVSFVRWAISPAGDDIARKNNYPPIPTPLKEKVFAKLKLITVNGEAIYT